MLRRTMLCFGPSGCGKTLFANALFGEMKLEAAKIDNAVVLRDDQFENLKRVFKTRKQFSIPGLLVEAIDELFLDLRSVPSARTYLIQQLKEPPDRCLYIATSQRPEILQPHEISAFADILPFSYPDLADRLSILMLHASKTSVEEGLDLQESAMATEWWSGRELKDLVDWAGRLDGTVSSESLRRGIKVLGDQVVPELRRRRMVEVLRFTVEHCNVSTIRNDVLSKYGELLREPETLTSGPINAGKSVLITAKELIMGDQYKFDQASGAIGRGARVEHMNSTQIWSNVGGIVDLAVLAQQLAKLRERLAKEAVGPEQYQEIGTISCAELEAKKGDGSKTMEYLAKAGRWAFEVATKIGETVAADAIKNAAGL